MNRAPAMTRAEYAARRLRVYEARRACRFEAADDGRSSYGSKSIRDLHVTNELTAALRADPRYWCDPTHDAWGYHDTSRYEWRAQVRRSEITRAVARRRAGHDTRRETETARFYLKPLKENRHV